MLQIVEQTHEERVKMYLRSTKKQLAEMLATRDVLQIDALPPGDWRSGYIYQSNT